MGEKYSAPVLIDTIIVDCNEAVKAAMTGEYVHFCGLIVDMVQKLSVLKDGITEETRQKDQIIRDLGGGADV